MTNYFRLVSDELLIKLNQIKQFIKKHNPTIGTLTEEILREFLKTYLPKAISIEQGFIMTSTGELSKQCDIIIYDSHLYAPYYRLNDIVIVPTESVVAVIEVKTTITKQIFHEVINYFNSLNTSGNFRSYLFIYNSVDISKIGGFFNSYKHKGDYQKFDHDTFQYLPDEITGINNSYHLKKASVISDKDMIGYSSFFFENEEGTEISALENFYDSVYKHVNDYLHNSLNTFTHKKRLSEKTKLKDYFAIELFDM